MWERKWLPGEADLTLSVAGKPPVAMESKKFNQAADFKKAATTFAFQTTYWRGSAQLDLPMVPVATPITTHWIHQRQHSWVSQPPDQLPHWL